MSSTIDSRLVTDPQLLDVVDEEWQRDVLPDDGAGGVEERGEEGRAGAERHPPPPPARHADVPVPPEAQPAADEQEEGPKDPRQPERWLELGLNTVH